MTNRSKNDANDDLTNDLSADDRDEAIDRLYDVALDPERYEALLDHWENAMSPLRAKANFHAPRLLDDPLIEGHFERANTFLDRVSNDRKVDEIAEILTPFDRIPALILDKTHTVRAANDAAKTLMNASVDVRLHDLPIHADDLEAVEQTLRTVFSDSKEDTAILRVRSKEKGRFTVLRLQLCHTANGQPLVLAASNEVGWPEGYSDILRSAFGLTGAEAEVVHGLVECCSVGEIAQTRSRSVETIRAQIKSILSKTETHSQVELVRLALSMMDMVSMTVNAAPGPRVVSRGYDTLKELEFQSLISSDGRRIDYLVLGDPAGKPVLFMPLDYGLVRWPAPAEAAAAAQGLRVIVPVRPGYGKSDMVAKNADYDAAMLADTAQILRAEGVVSCPAITLGGDFYYAVQYARANPGVLTAIAAFGGVPPLTRREQFERMEKWHRFILAGAKYTPHLLPFMVKAGFLLARKIGKRGFIHAVYGQNPADVNTFEDPDVFEAIVTGSEVALSDTQSAHAAFSRQLLAGQTGDWSADLEDIRGKLPVFFHNGLQDPQVPPLTLEECQRDFDWIDYTVYEDAGQLVFFRYWKDALQRITPFLS